MEKRSRDHSSSSTAEHTRHTDSQESVKRKTERDKDGSTGTSFCGHGGLK